MPGAVFGEHRPSGGDVMNMRVVLEGTTPGMKDAKEAGKIAPDMFFIRDELLYGLRGGLEEGRISRALMTTNEPTETFGHRERDHEMMPGKLAIHLSFKPLTCLNVLTGWAVAIAEVSVDDVEVSTVLTFVIRNPCLPGAAGDHGIERFSVLPGYLGTEVFDVFRTEGLEDLIY